VSALSSRAEHGVSAPLEDEDEVVRAARLQAACGDVAVEPAMVRSRRPCLVLPPGEEEEAMSLNAQFVGSQGDNVIIMMPKRVMTKAEAINLAVWLVVVAGDYECEKFNAEMKEALNS
jgi:hypothetical protein